MMDKIFLILILVQLLTSLVQSQPEAQDVVQHKEEKVTVNSILPQLFFETRLLRNELLAVRTDVDSLKGIEDKIKVLSLRMDSLEANTNSLAYNKVTSQQLQRSANSDTTIHELKEEITVLQQGLSREKHYVRKLESVITNMTENMLSVDKQFTDAQEKLDKMDEKILTVDKTEAEKWETVNDLLEKNDAETKNMLTNYNSVLDALTNKTALIDSSFSQLLSKLERQRVAFSAYLRETTPELPVGSTVIFDRVVYQAGEGYNPENGIFTCPESGVYMFSVVVECSSPATAPKTFTAQLVVDSVWKALVVSENHHKGQDDQASNFVILSLNQGQKVWLATNHYGGVKLFNHFSTFSGALLYN